MRLAKNEHLLKVREDSTPVKFLHNSDQDGEPFILAEDSDCSWTTVGAPFGIEKLRERIEPWLTALFQSEHLSLLVGSGLSKAVHYLALGKGMQGMGEVSFKTRNYEITMAANASAEATGRSAGNIEDQLRVANELLRGLQILGIDDGGLADEAERLEAELSEVITTFADAILAGERSVASADSERSQAAFNYLVSFLMSFASRTGTRDRLHIFTTN